MQLLEGHVRIGELSRRVGIRPELLRAWEHRYGLLRPSRSAGGFRLYSDADEQRVRAMQGFLAQGYAAAEAARLTLGAAEAGAVPGAAGELDAAARDFRLGLDAFDDATANRALDRLLASFGTETVLADVVLPYLRDLGERWARGEASVAQEHFASNVLRGRLLGLARGWGQGGGPRALLACAPGELHDLALIIFGLALRARGWRVTYLGPDTPLATLADAAATLGPDLIVVTATSVERIHGAGAELRRLAGAWRLALGGQGATEAAAREARAELLPDDPLAAADAIARR